MRQVAQARVHLVLPERSPFRDQQTKPSASVVLQLAGSGSLDRNQVEGVASLVAGAIEGMALADVTVLDTRGNLLSNPDAGNADLTLTSNQLRTQRAVETHLTESGQSMLDRVLGPGKAVVRIAAALDFSRSVQETEAIDPESATIISEEKLEENSDLDASNSTVRNYELSRTRERSEKSVGDIRTLTVSVVLDHKRSAVQPAAEGDAAEPVPYTDEELREIEALVKNAVGFDPDRGDRFAIHQARFDTSIDDQIVEELRGHETAERVQLYLRYGLMVLALLLAAWLIRSAVQRVSAVAASDDPLQLKRTEAPTLGRHTAGALAAQSAAALPPPADAPAELAEDFYTSKLSGEAKARLKAKEKMYEETKQQVIGQPEEAAELLRAWLAEDQMAAPVN
jgi:flagellar M-ring protein FliF